MLRRERKAIFIRKKAGLAAAAVLLAAGMFAAVFSPAVVGAAATKRELPIYSVERDNRAVALSFDAAWGNEDTQQLIDTLGRYGVRATFFVVGEWVDKYPESVRALADAGHEVMNHSDDHAHFTKLSAEEIAANVSACSEKIESVTGTRPTLFRFPYGEYDDNAVLAVRAAGPEPVQWDVDSLDWKGLDAATMTDRVLSRAEPGSIILFHNAAEHTPEALPAIIEGLLAKGLEPVPVSELLLTGDYAIDNTGRQHKAG